MLEERLDRAIGNPSWHACLPNASLVNLVAPILDHNPIMLDTNLVTRAFRSRSFHFEKTVGWMSLI